ncbi:hypothetical protein ACFSQE_08660 [Vogesella fluminis]|uniref:hypothetical protein n=1 Tax=Vogesella fluminis TaxID=1069161 RepID=UPI003635ADA6
MAAAAWLLPLSASLLLTDGDYPSLSLLLPLHLLALGVLGNAMLGALLQMVAVVSGVPCMRPTWWRLVVWSLWQLATASLCWGFYQSLAPPWLQLASVLFVLPAVSLSGLLFDLWRSPATDGSSRGLRLALGLLLLTMLLGLSMLAVLGWGRPWPLLSLLPLHRLAAQGWVLLLVMAVAQVIAPMFLLTASYPGWWQRHGSMLWLLSLLAGACGLWWLPQWPWWWLAWLPLALFAVLSLRLLRTSRRPQEWLLPYWRLSFALLALLAALLPLLMWQGAAPWLARALAWCLLGGFALTLVVGMLYRIVPFLLWLHLKNAAPPRHRIPPLQTFMPEIAPRRSLRMLLLVQPLAALWVWRPDVGWPLALALIALLLLLSLHFIAAARQYRAARRVLPPQPASA